LTPWRRSVSLPVFVRPVAAVGPGLVASFVP
jgi:hypothetical protein